MPTGSCADRNRMTNHRFERVAFAPLGLLQSAYGVHGHDSLGRPLQCGDAVALSYGFGIYWIVYRCLVKFKIHHLMLRDPAQLTRFFSGAR